MTADDARFEDANDEPLRLKIADAEDLVVASSLLQDSVFAAADHDWNRKRREFSLLVNRFRWERKANESEPERVRSIIQFKDVLGADLNDLRGGGPPIFSLLSVEFSPGEGGTGSLLLNLAGDREIKIDVECLDASLTDVTRPYNAVSRSKPRHGGTE